MENGVPVEESINPNNNGFGYNYILNSNIKGGVINNGNIINSIVDSNLSDSVVKDYLQKRSLNYFENDLTIHFMYDFSEISQCNILISSPSTFSIMAGIFGKIKKIYHCKEWVDYRIEEKDKFWIDLNDLRFCNNSKVYVI